LIQGWLIMKPEKLMMLMKTWIEELNDFMPALMLVGFILIGLIKILIKKK